MKEKVIKKNTKKTSKRAPEKPKKKVSFKQLAKLHDLWVEAILSDFKKEKPRYWEKYRKKRVYFQAHTGLIDLEVSFFDTGKVSKATLKGEDITGERAIELLDCIKNVKIFFDVYTGKISIDNFNCEDGKELFKEIRKYFIDKIRNIKNEVRKNFNLYEE